MMKMKTRMLSGLLAVFMLPALYMPAGAAGTETVSAALQDTAAYVYKTVEAPQMDSIGGDWAVLGLARSGYDVPVEYYQTYYATVEAYAQTGGGLLHDKKYTEHSRVILALTSIGKDAGNVAGYDLTLPLGDYDKTVGQGLNGPVWALIALDSGNYPMPENKQAETQASRQMYIDHILSLQLPDGGWSLSWNGSSDASAIASDADITGMALQALARYQEQPEVAKAVRAALDCISKSQGADGGFESWGAENCEGCVQVLVALCELGISPDDARFVKNGNTLVDNLLGFYTKGAGFAHSPGSGSNQMATEQGLYALAAVQRMQEGRNSLYSMDDALEIVEGEGDIGGSGLSGKDPAVKPVPVTSPGKTFKDIEGNAGAEAIEALASRAIIDGKGEGLFDPNASMTRAEFAAIVVRALGLTPAAAGQFTDVPAGKWYCAYVGTAYSFEIVNGKSESLFDPDGTITRQEAAAMVARAARLCGMDTDMDAAAVRDMLAQFTDYMSVDDWARPALAFCYGADILNQSDLEIQPKTAVKRFEVAQMLYNLLDGAELL